VKRILPFLKNKFIITSLVFLTYIIFIDDNDIFFITNQNEKLSELEIRNEKMKKKLEETKSILNKIEDLDFLEAYARETKFFKRDNEEIFVITYK
jgi:proteasome assembly chaperone (PAC2) family protein